MTEPSGGSDVQNIKTRAIKDGDHYVVNGQKYSFPTGFACDFVVLATKTDPAARAKGSVSYWSRRIARDSTRVVTWRKSARMPRI